MTNNDQRILLITWLGEPGEQWGLWGVWRPDTAFGDCPCWWTWRTMKDQTDAYIYPRIEINWN